MENRLAVTKREGQRGRLRLADVELLYIDNILVCQIGSGPRGGTNLETEFVVKA